MNLKTKTISAGLMLSSVALLAVPQQSRPWRPTTCNRLPLICAQVVDPLTVTCEATLQGGNPGDQNSVFYNTGLGDCEAASKTQQDICRFSNHSPLNYRIRCFNGDISPSN